MDDFYDSMTTAGDGDGGGDGGCDDDCKKMSEFERKMFEINNENLTDSFF